MIVSSGWQCGFLLCHAGCWQCGLRLPYVCVAGHASSALDAILHYWCGRMATQITARCFCPDVAIKFLDVIDKYLD